MTPKCVENAGTENLHLLYPKEKYFFFLEKDNVLKLISKLRCVHINTELPTCLETSGMQMHRSNA